MSPSRLFAADSIVVGFRNRPDAGERASPERWGPVWNPNEPSGLLWSGKLSSMMAADAPARPRPFAHAASAGDGSGGRARGGVLLRLVRDAGGRRRLPAL